MEILFYLKKYKYFVLGLIVLIILSIFIFKPKEQYQITKIEEQNIETKEEIVINKIKFDIKGAVNNPGVYEIEENSRVSDAINISGGLTTDADTSVINLSKNLTDEMVIIIYTKQEIEEMIKGNTSIKYIEKECICPKLENDACIEEKITNNETTNQNTNSKISLNNASLEELTSLTGIGLAKAKLIIEYRQLNGGFKSIEELTNVKGIGTATYEKIKDRLTL